jgi:hypothetical protein
MLPQTPQSLLEPPLPLLRGIAPRVHSSPQLAIAVKSKSGTPTSSPEYSRWICLYLAKQGKKVRSVHEVLVPMPASISIGPE